MKRFSTIILATCISILAHAELKVHFTFETLQSSVGNHTGTLKNGASLTHVAGIPVLSLGANNGYFDMGPSVGEVIASLNGFTISTNVYIPSTTTLGGNGNFIYTFANSTNIGSDANGCIFFGANETRYTICLSNYLEEKNVMANYRFPTGSWHTLTYRQIDNVGELFLDGEQVAIGQIPIKPSDLGLTPYNFLGRPCYQGDIFLKDAYYNDFRLYDNAIDDATIALLTANINTLNSGMNEQQIDELMNETTLGSDRFYDDIVLPTPNKNGVTVTWASSDESIISRTGRVTRPAYGSGTACVTLTATFSKGSISLQKEFVVYVPANDMSDADIVDGDLMSLTINGHLENLMTNLYLPTRGKKGSDISWQSSHPDILSHEGELLSQPKNKTDITLTATISLRNAVATKTFHITAAKRLSLTYYLFAYFNGNAQWQEQICFALSTDGYNYTPLNNGAPIINSADIALKQAVRDPHILRGEDGYFYMVVTDMRSSQGWSSNDGMVLLRSADMVNWTHSAIDFPTRWPERFDRNTLTQVWAPQTIYDPEEGKYMVYYAIGESGKNYITYYSYANEDFTDLSEPQVLYDHDGLNTIDADIVWHDGRYHMFFKTEGQGNGIQKATAKTLRGTWTPEYKYLQQTSAAVEGSGVFKKFDSDEWVLMYDCYTSGMYEYCTSSDLSNFTKVCNSANTNIFTPRHGTTIAITAEEAERLVKVWPSDGLDIIDWVDITDLFVRNPRFDNNSSYGWTVNSNAHSQALNFQTMEFWNGAFNIYQTIEVPNGTYRLSVQSFYNPAYDETGYLYANETRQPIVARSSEGLTSNYNPGGWDRVTINGSRRYIPNNMESGSYCFEQGIYNNSMEVEVTEGTLTFGLVCEEAFGANWCMFDNFKLKHLGHIEIITMEEILLSHPSLDMIEGESSTLNATILPENAVNDELRWRSTNPEVASVDKHGLVRALKGGKATIIVEAADGSGVEASCEVNITALEGSWLDVTEAYINNPQFENNSNQGWNVIANAGSQQVSGGSMEIWNGTFNISQTFNVPNGKYRLSAQAYYRTSSNDQAYNAFLNGTADITTYLYANEAIQPIVNIYSEYMESATGGRYYTRDNKKFFPDDMSAGTYCFTQGLYHNSVITEVTDGTLAIGLFNENFATSNWCMFDNFRLEYYGEYIPVTSITLSQSELTLKSNESVTLTATIKPDNATYRNIVWSSDNPMTAGVDQNGVVTAYQEGTTIIRATSKDESRLSAMCKITVKGTPITAEAIIINEIQSSNIDMFVDPSFNYGAWIELYNSTDMPTNINYLYVSDNPENLTKYNLGIRGTIPAKGYRVLWFDHYNFHYAPSQIDTKLDFDGGTIYISDSEGNLITSQDYPVAVPRTSYARIADGAEEWGFTAEPTPGESNIGSTFAEERLEAPIVDKEACLFTAPFTFNVMIPYGATLHYTTDGTTPTLTNGHTSKDGVFHVDYTTTYRFRLFEEGKLPSQVITRSFIYRDRDYMLPIISVVTDPINLYDDSLGVYVKGVNGRSGNGQSTPCNWNMDWDRPVNFEYITPEEGMVVNQEVDFAMCGGWSRAFTPHSFKLKAGKIYEGLNSIDYPFFTDKPHLKHKTLQIRNGGNDTGCRIKDAALQEIVRRSGLDVEGQASQPVMHFINGEYKGMLNMREPNNKHYAYANWGIDTDEMDQFEMSPDSGYVQMEGTREAFLKWYNLSKDADNEDIYEEIRRLVDIDEYINYMAVEMYLGAVDWPQNNIKGFRPRTEDGRFRFVLFDLDGTLGTTSPFSGFESRQTWTFDYIYDTGNRFTEEIEFVTIFLNMLQNDTFRKQFIDSYCLVAGSVFEPSRCQAIINEMADIRAAALSLEGQSPYSTANTLKNSLSNRQNTMINALVNYWRMGLNHDMKQEISIASNIEGAALRLNDMPIPTSRFSGSLFTPITLKAEPKAGYRFIGWKETNNATEKSTTLIARGDSWDYYDKGSLDNKDWTNARYSTSTWETGNAPLGYFTSDPSNNRGYNTTLDYGTDANAKRPTYYFRKSFRLSQAPSANERFVLNYTIDDGMIVYINNTEVTRYLLPDGEVTYSTYATSYAYDNPDNGSIVLDATLLKQGTNVIAIEVHNCDNKSSDIYLDAELIQVSAQDHIVSKEAEYVLPSNGSYDLIAMYELLTTAERQEEAILPVRINEISADNSIYINDYYKKNDWIELVNTTSEPIDIEGMYLSDNVNKPTKFQIIGANNANTIIDPHGHLIIWADKLTTLTQLHASFKLAAEGGYIMLTAADQSWNDVLYYEPHLGTESVGLYPDGSDEVYIMSTPTIGRENTINSYAAWLEQPEIDTDIERVITDEELLKLEYYDRSLHIHSPEGTWSDVTIYAATGKICTRTTIALHNGYAVLPIATYGQGIYIVSVTDSTGETQTLKIRID